MRNGGDPRLVQSDERFNRREEDRVNRKTKLADDNPEDVVRGGVEVDGNEAIADNGVDVDIQVEEDNLETSGEMTYLDAANAQYMEEQIIDLMDRDLGDDREMEKVAKELGNKTARTIMMSTGIGITRYNEEIKSEAISGKSMVAMNRLHVSRAIEVIKE